MTKPQKQASPKSVQQSLNRIEVQVEALVRNLVIPPALLDEPGNLSPRRFGLHSQFEEDGISLALHAAAGTQTRRFVEIGCGTNGGNAGILAAELGWKGLMVDANPKAVGQTLLLNPNNITGVAGWVTRDNVNALIVDNGFEGDVDQLGIDLDGNDYWILESLTACRARVLVLEYNSAFGPSLKVTVPYSEDFKRGLDDDLSRVYFGASLGAMEALARAKGYGLVGVERSGANAFFLADGLAEDIPRRRPEEVYRTLPKHLTAAHDTGLLDRLERAGMPLLEVGEPASGAAMPEIIPAPRARPKSRATYFEEAAGETELLAVETPRGTFLVNPRDQTIGRSLFTRGERGELAVLDHAVALLSQSEHSQRPMFVDCGAGIGTTTVSALQTGGFERAVALEPEPTNFRLLKANLALNDLDARVVVKQIAVSAHSDQLELLVHPTNWGAHEVFLKGVRSLTVPPGHTATVSTQSTTIDDLVEAGTLVPDEVGILWVNVQGHEGAVLAGAEKVLATGTPVVVAFAPALLERAGGLEDIYALSTKYYETFVDLRKVVRTDEGLKARRRPVDELRSIGAAMTSDSERRYADVLLLSS